MNPYEEVAKAHAANVARTAEALWASVDEIHEENRKRLGEPVEDVTAGIPSILSVGQRRAS